MTYSRGKKIWRIRINISLFVLEIYNLTAVYINLVGSGYHDYIYLCLMSTIFLTAYF
jgi:hypothetical protein